jgi:hypothetical protein
LTTRRTLWAFVFGGLVGLGLIAVAVPFPGLALRVVWESLYPANISWEGKTAWRRCDGAIAGQTSWPPSPQAVCEAMHMCANEAPLTDHQKQRLAQLIRGIAGCQEP